MASTPYLNPEPALVEGECCNHYTTLVPQKNRLPSLVADVFCGHIYKTNTFGATEPL